MGRPSAAGWSSYRQRMSEAYGECVISTLREGSRVRLRIDRADPRILIAREELASLAPPGWDCPATSDGETVRVHGENRTVFYRVGRYLPDLGCYEAEWPD